MTTTPHDPHAGQRVLSAGAPLAEARAAVVLVHGRGATAAGILELGAALDVPGVALAAPQAAGGAWYPYSFLAPVAMNEPHLTSALATLDRVLADVARGGVPPERTVLLGFSQGACLSAEWAARRARRLGGVCVLTGGVIGADGTPRDYAERYGAGAFDGTPVLLTTGDPDLHVPVTRVAETAALFEAMGAAVDARVYPGRPHTVGDDEIAAARAVVVAAAAGGVPAR